MGDRESLGRQAAFLKACSNLRDWYVLVQEGAPEAVELGQALLDSPFIDVVHAMTRLKPSLAPTVVGQRPSRHSTNGAPCTGSDSLRGPSGHLAVRIRVRDEDRRTTGRLLAQQVLPCCG
ncbi:hypothetical protein [Kitasatospora azatica]|uniref:hypothetical protein n=1 Tax=Kitasatospora azatica TaxID=58347 RepID=UPI0018DC748D|nr:hypothetical protein [Kitasatospora azatica]